MFLAIDNTEKEALIFFISNNATWKKYEFEKSGEDALLSGLESVLKDEKAAVEELEGIVVKVGVGTFTTTRLAVTFGNTLGYALKIPVIAEKDFDFDRLPSLLKATPVGQYAHALYSGLPRLGGQ